MEKRIFFFMIILIALLFVKFVNAGLGITPAITRIDFAPNGSYLINYNILFAEPNQKVSVNITGDFVEYAKSDKKTLNASEGFTVYIDLPQKVNIYGNRKINIRVKEYSDEISRTGLSTLLEVVGLIVIRVPYPGKYGEIRNFYTYNANEGESFSFTLDLENLGSEQLNPEIYFEVYSDNKLLDKYNIGSKAVLTRTVETFEKIVDINKYTAGNYNVIAYVRLDDSSNTLLKTNTTLRIGSLFVEINNWTREVYLGKISPFDIDIESKWNNDIKSVYAEVNVSYENGSYADFFKTSPVSLGRWGKSVLNGFFNAENLAPGNYKANITLFYEETTSSKFVDLRVAVPEVPKKESKILDYIIIFGVAGLIILIAVIILIVLLKRKNREDIISYGSTKRKK
jgi:hypothetical protein